MVFLVYPIGFEPTAPSVGGLCSIQLSYGYVYTIVPVFANFCKRFYAKSCSKTAKIRFLFVKSGRNFYKAY